jgi:hypothetical protein
VTDFLCVMCRQLIEDGEPYSELGTRIEFVTSDGEPQWARVQLHRDRVWCARLRAGVAA